MGLVSIQSFLMKRMTAVAEEIFNALKDNIIEYEQEIERLKQENCCLRSALTETRHDTLQDGVLQGPVGSELSEIRVKMEVATVMSHEPLTHEASTSTSHLSEDFKWQEPHQFLSLLPNVLLKNEDSGGTDPQSSITVKSEQCDNQTGESNSSAVQSSSNCHAEIPVPEQGPPSLQVYIETSDEVLQKGVQNHQNTSICKICSKSFSTKGSLQRHMLVHQNMAPFCCVSCGSRFKSKFQLKEHERLHTERRAKNRTEEPVSSRLSHVEMILQPDSVNVNANSRQSTRLSLPAQVPGKFSFRCKICDRPFKRQTNLKNHMLLHQCDRNYPCIFCGRRFFKSWHLAEHLRIHTGEKPFGCSKCGKAFVQWNQARSHIIKHHEGDMSLLSKENT
ncbi:zinc finger and SCAN domain-containing protein 12 [Sinocyclocheilus rhinocerous]|uniref:Zinc finger and SCAN domain-containing protein 12-like n=1 Tax=Sinocyclocheilus rhinocerous TaxID=307959 RepID=A0A673LC55_9TELE|nr:PREDICTED: zinc finger and SCAN domain-containing protein 12-like [Sinocyclocheilus rhinocerous]